MVGRLREALLWLWQEPCLRATKATQTDGPDELYSHDNGHNFAGNINELGLRKLVFPHQ